MRKKGDRSTSPPAPDLSLESALWANHLEYIAGIDEAGRGAWAGPVTAAAVILPCDLHIIEIFNGVRDSKQLSPVKRGLLAPLIKRHALAWGVGFADNIEIDQYGIIFATQLAMMRAITTLSSKPEHLLIDALFLPEVETAQTSLIKGDQRSLSIAAASILAKTARDAWMIEIQEEYPAYRFDRHKGYGTRLHQEQLHAEGACPLHRRTYQPVFEIIKKKECED